MLHNCLTNHRLKLAITATYEFIFNFFKGLTGHSGVNGHQIGHTGLIFLIIAHAVLRIRVGDGTLELLHHHFRRIHQQYTAGVLILRFGHFGGGVGQAHNTGANLGNKGFGNLEHVAVDAVKAASDHMGQFHVLLLIFAHRHQVGLIQQNITGHQAGIGKQTCIDIICVLGGLVLKLGHARQFAKHRVAIQHPAQLRMLMHMALDEQGVLLGIQTTGNVLRQLLQGSTAQIRRILAHGNGMQVSHKVETIILVGTFCPVLYSTQVRTQSQITRRLNAG